MGYKDPQIERQYQKDYYQQHKENLKVKSRNRNIPPHKRREYHMRWAYDLEPDEYETILQSQDSKCAICGLQSQLHVDHCHATKRVRGLLCVWCNTGLGQFKDDKERLQKAIEYLS